ncbi:MAG TPA: hypothetical protein VD966_00090 [Pyrinomonadaceae bacterium]|nr:hypothetical protein [Pyrinomonadaceae bacterium]
MSEKFFKRVFFIGALWNILGGIFIIVFTDRIFNSANLSPPHPPNYYQSWIALFMTFGLGYYFAYKDMYANKNIILLGLIGKVAFAIVFIINMIFYRGQIPTLFLIPVIGDLVFAVLFGLFLRFAKERSK